MYQKLNQYIQTPLTLTPREVLLGACACACGAVACLMTGMVVGMFISPRKNVAIGSNNGSNNQGNIAPSAETANGSGQENEE